MGEPIKVGDLVVVAKACPHCGSHEDLGKVFRVHTICTLEGGWNCCGYEGRPQTGALVDKDEGGYVLQILKRIPPLSELEGQRTEEKLHV